MRPKNQTNSSHGAAGNEAQLADTIQGQEQGLPHKRKVNPTFQESTRVDYVQKTLIVDHLAGG